MPLRIDCICPHTDFSILLEFCTYLPLSLEKGPSSVRALLPFPLVVFHICICLPCMRTVLCDALPLLYHKPAPIAPFLASSHFFLSELPWQLLHIFQILDQVQCRPYEVPYFCHRNLGCLGITPDIAQLELMWAIALLCLSCKLSLSLVYTILLIAFIKVTESNFLSISLKFDNAFTAIFTSVSHRAIRTLNRLCRFP